MRTERNRAPSGRTARGSVRVGPEFAREQAACQLPAIGCNFANFKAGNSRPDLLDSLTCKSPTYSKSNLRSHLARGVASASVLCSGCAVHFQGTRLQ